MKKTILILFVFLSALSINAQEPVIKILLGDGSYKTYNLSEIQNLSFTKSQSNDLMKIYYQKTQVNTVAKSDIDSMKFESEQSTFTNLVIYIKGSTPKSYQLSEIDSIIITNNVNNETVTIGTQVWTLKNLDVSTYRNGDAIRHAVSNADWVDAGNKKEGAWCYYENDPANGAIYGKLYNWFAVNDPRGLAPIGYHVPSEEEWTTLSTYLGGESVAGGKMKEIGTTHWLSPNEGATNSSGFTALPGGYRNRSGKFDGGGYWWSATESNDSSVTQCHLRYDGTSLFRNDDYKVLGFSVRCVRDNASIFPKINSINPTSARIGEEITITGTGFGSSRGPSFVSFTGANAGEYTSWSDTDIYVKVPIGATSGKVSVTVFGEKSNEVDFTISECNGRSSYSNVTIGSQVWMGENLDVCNYRNGDAIPEVTDPTQWANLTTGAWCYYNNDPANGEIYGKLYNWYAVNDSRGLAPSGWHIPSDAEWTTLIDYLGGEEVAGGKMKETGTAHWKSPNVGATNESGFSALPGGSRYYNVDGFDYLSYNGIWWSTMESEYDAMAAWNRQLYYNYTYVNRKDGDKVRGFSVRCVRD